jgi:hypothetical protein
LALIAFDRIVETYIDIPDELAAHFLRLHPMSAKSWLDRLPHAVNETCERWGLELDELATGGKGSYVAFGTRTDGTQIVFKAVPDVVGGQAEIESLRLRRGAGAPRLLASDRQRAIFAMERIVPGVPLERIVPGVPLERIVPGVPLQHDPDNDKKAIEALTRLHMQIDADPDASDISRLADKCRNDLEQLVIRNITIDTGLDTSFLG